MSVRSMPGTVPRNGTLPAGFTPYVYGATAGQPSAARPGRVLAGIEAGITEAGRRPRPGPAAVAVAAEPEPPGDGRCADCGYLLTAPGHKIACGDDE